MRHGWRSECTCDPTQDSRSDDRYRQNFPTLNAGTSPAFAQRSTTLGLTRKILATSADVSNGSKLLSFPLPAATPLFEAFHRTRTGSSGGSEPDAVTQRLPTLFITRVRRLPDKNRIHSETTTAPENLRCKASRFQRHASSPLPDR
jgi:hypothetical protein